jgi:hypothetical protein
MSFWHEAAQSQYDAMSGVGERTVLAMSVSILPRRSKGLRRKRVILQDGFDGHHKKSDLGVVCEPVHTGGESGNAKCGPHQRRMVHAGLDWLKIMRKPNDIEKTRELTESELDAVSGGQREPTYHRAKVTIPDLKLS